MYSLLCLLLALVMVLSGWTVGAAATDGAPAQRPGFVMLQIDGLSEPALRAALEADAMPFVGGLIDDGSHILGSWRTTAASATPVTQAGLLHGSWRHIPGFRWWDRETGRLHDFLDREQAREFGDSLSGPADLLAAGGASITNLFDGGAPRVVLTATDFDGAALAWEVVRYVADLPKDIRVAAGLVDGTVAGLRRLARGEAAPFAGADVKRKAPVPIVGPALEWALVDVTAAAVLQEIGLGTPLVYATFTTYDEVGHYASSRHPAAFDALGHIDEALELIDRATREAERPYHLIILSDHGQTEGQPFALRWDQTLTELIGELMAQQGSGTSSSGVGDPVVAASGNLAHVYFPPAVDRLDQARIEALHPGLAAGLAAHAGIGLVVMETATGRHVALGAEGSRDLGREVFEGQDPLEPYGPLAATAMTNIAAAANAGDLVVVATYDPETRTTFAFEPQNSSHGGIGGPQTEPFLLYPTELEPGQEPLFLVGLDALRATFDRWLSSEPMGSPEPTSTPKRQGDEVCVSSEVDGAVGRVCARRQGFGAMWTADVLDESGSDRRVRATISLDVADAPDESAVLSIGEDELTAASSGRFLPSFGRALGDITIETCVDRRFAPDRCHTESAPLPQLSGAATPAQRARLETLVFEMPVERFMEEWTKESHSGLDAGFDWSSDGCSAGPAQEIFDERLQPACVRHDFAYRNFGQLGLDATDAIRERADDQLAADIAALGQGYLADGLRESLQRFAAPVFYGDDLAALWGLPAFVADRLGSGDLRSSD